MPLRDSCSRPLLNLRVAVTQQCNLRCAYCHMEGEEKKAEQCSSEMTADEILRIMKIAVSLGISRVKLTGGEPLMRKDIVEIVRGAAGIPGLSDLSMTTNGTMLASLAKELHTSGLNRVNVSLPTLSSAVYSKLTGGRVERVLQGVVAAVKASLDPVKLNMIVLNGVNDNEVPKLLRFAEETGAILQLIELEPINIDDTFYNVSHKPLDEYEMMLKKRAVRFEARRYMQNRGVYYLPNVKVEVIHPIENTDFCLHCTRIRVTSTGKLKPCLMKNDDLVDILTPMRNGATDEELVELFEKANMERRPYSQS